MILPLKKQHWVHLPDLVGIYLTLEFFQTGSGIFSSRDYYRVCECTGFKFQSEHWCSGLCVKFPSSQEDIRDAQYPKTHQYKTDMHARILSANFIHS